MLLLYTVTITESPVCIAHQLHLPYESKCNHWHGHNYTVEVVITSHELNPHGMVVDFTAVKTVIKKYDHAVLGNVPNPELIGSSRFFPQVEPSTAENFAHILYEDICAVLALANPRASIKAVSVWETPNNKVTVE